MAHKLFGSTLDPATTTTKGFIRWCKYSCGVVGVVSAIKLKVGANGNVRVALYSNSSGAPSALLAESASTAVTTGWNTVNLGSAVSVTSGTDYWLATQADADSVDIYSLVTSFPSKYLTQAYGAYPNPAGAVTDLAGYEIAGMQAWGDATFSQTPTDAVVLVATVAKKDSKSISSPVTLASTIIKKISKAAFSDAFSFNEVIAALRAYYLALTDAITLADSLSKSVFKTFLDTFSQVESLGKNIYKGIVDAVSVADTYFNQIWVALSDVINVSDKVNKSLSKVLISVTSLAEALSKQMSKIASETIPITDTLTKLLVKIESGTIALVDGVTRSVAKTVLEVIEVLDTRQFYTRLYLEESLSLGETIAKLISKIESASFTLNDTIGRLIEKSLTSSLSFTETIQKNVWKSLSATLTIAARALREWTHYESSDLGNLLRDTFYLEVNTVEADFTGGHTDNWDFSRTFKGRLSRLPIKEQIGNDKVTVYATHKLYCEYMAVTTADRVRLGTRYFDIITVENPRNWNKHLELLLLEVE